MSDVIVRISTNNAAFDDRPAAEVHRILLQAAERVHARGIPQADELYPLFDYNGNLVGHVKTEED